MRVLLPMRGSNVLRWKNWSAQNRAIIPPHKNTTTELSLTSECKLSGRNPHSGSQSWLRHRTFRWYFIWRWAAEQSIMSPCSFYMCFWKRSRYIRTGVGIKAWETWSGHQGNETIEDTRKEASFSQPSMLHTALKDAPHSCLYFFFLSSS